MIDFAEPGELGVFVDEEVLANLEKKMEKRGFLEGSDMATTFNMMRANDLVWSFVVNNYLLGEDYPALFANPRLRDRLRVYSIAYDVRELLMDPPDRPVDQLSHLHPYHRLADTIGGRGHIDLLDVDPVPVLDGVDHGVVDLVSA